LQLLETRLLLTKNFIPG